MTSAYEPTRQLFEEVDRRINRNRWVATAIVQEVDKADKTIKIKILPELQESGWVRPYFLTAGPNYFSGQLPEVGAEVVCLFLGADPNSVFVLAGGFINDETPELAEDYQFSIYDKSGNSVVLASDGITIRSEQDVKITVEGKAVIDAPTIELGEGATESVVKGNAFKALYNAHTHATGLGPSGPPVVPMATELSTKVKTV